MPLLLVFNGVFLILTLKMGDTDIEKEYFARKKRLKDLHEKLSNPQAKKNQEIYHRIMGSAEADETDSDSE